MGERMARSVDQENSYKRGVLDGASQKLESIRCDFADAIEESKLGSDSSRQEYDPELIAKLDFHLDVLRAFGEYRLRLEKVVCNQDHLTGRFRMCEARVFKDDWQER